MTRNRRRIALATCAALPDLDPDDRLIVEPLRSLGVTVTAAVWDDPTLDWAAFDLVVVRDTWDYTARRDQFLAWTRAVPRLLNPADVIEWNTDKRYLAELTAKGLTVVPTTWLAPGEAVRLPAKGIHVLKPAIGAGSVDAGRFDLDDASEATLAREHAQRLLAAGKTVMIQPYLVSMYTRGETGVIFVGDEFSHAVGKAPMLSGEHHDEAGGLFKSETIESRTPTSDELEIARRAIAATPGGADRLLYARVDLVSDEDDEPLIMEVELTEPSLFLVTAPGSERRFAAAIMTAATDPDRK